jgi:hypothetical protein
MTEEPQDKWFYTREGERLGPVAFSELQAKAREAGLNPRLDMVWKQGMEEWKAAGEIDGLFEKGDAPESQKTLSSTAGGAGKAEILEQEDSVAEVMSHEGDWPGARRRSILFMTFIFPLVWGGLYGLIASFLGPQLGPEIMEYIGLAAALLPVIFIIYFILMRLVNLGMSRWWFFGIFVPVLNLWIGYRCFACPPGYAYHKKIDGAGIALAILYWLSFLLTQVSIAALIFIMLGEAKNPALQELLEKVPAELREKIPTP